MKRRVAIVGAGISGLTAAYVLARDHAGECDVTLFESSHRAGGTVETIAKDGYVIEGGPDSWVTEKPWAEVLARELGLGSKLLPSSDAVRRTYIARSGRLLPLPDGMRMMVPSDLTALRESPLFSAEALRAYTSEPARADELRTTALLSRGADADESVADFVRRHFGDEVTRTVAGPLLAGVFGGDVESLSARALLAPFVALEAECGSLIAGLQQRQKNKATDRERSIFTTLSCGLEELVRRMAARLPDGCLRTATQTHSLTHSDTGWLIHAEGSAFPFDHVLLATPLPTTRALLSCLHDRAGAATAALLPSEATSSVLVAFGYDARAATIPTIPTGFGFLTASNDPSSLLACTFLDQKFAGRAPAGRILLRAFFSSEAAEQLARQSDEAIVQVAHMQLSAILGALPERAEITVVRRWPQSLPQYSVGHMMRMRALDETLASLPGLHIAGNALHGVGLPDLIREATDRAHAIARM